MTRIKKLQGSIAITQSFPAPQWLGSIKNISPCSLNSVEVQCWTRGAKEERQSGKTDRQGPGAGGRGWGWGQGKGTGLPAPLSRFPELRFRNSFFVVGSFHCGSVMEERQERVSLATVWELAPALLPEAPRVEQEYC